MMFVALRILYISAELYASSAVKYIGELETVAADGTNTELVEGAEMSRPDLFLQTHRNQKMREAEHSTETAFTAASELMQPTALPNKMQQDSSAGLAQMNSLLHDLAAMNERLAEGDGQLSVVSGLGASSLANEMSEGSQVQLHKGGWQTRSDSATRNQKMKQQVVSNAPDLLPPVGTSKVPDSRSQQTFMEQSFINSSPQQLFQATEADSGTFGPYSSYGLPSKRSSMLEMRTPSFDRPQASSGKADIIYFGLFGKLFYGTDLKSQEFTIDNIMTLEWSDSRTPSLILSGQDLMTMSYTEAKSKIWLPGIWITNKIGHKSDLISSSLTIRSNGTVTLVERSLAVIKNRFKLEEYPFDEQTLRLAIASEKYMLTELILLPLDDPEVSGLRDGFFQNEPYEMVDFSVKADDDVDGLLQKSRGYMEVVVQRTPSKYQHKYLFPALLYSAISCAVFWLPFTPAFVLARLALSIIILLVFSNFTIIVDAELPEGAPYNWIDLICIIVRLHMFSVICINIFTEVALYTMGCRLTALQMNNEMKLLSPLAIAFAFLLIFIGSQTKGALNLTSLTILLPIVFALYIVTYVTCSAFSLAADLRKHEVEKFEGAYGGEAPYSGESLTPVPRYYDS